MRVTRIGAASLLSMSLLVGCSGSPGSEPLRDTGTTQSSIRLESVAQVSRWSDRILNFNKDIMRPMPPGVRPVDPSYQPGDDKPIGPNDPACLVCPAGMGPRADVNGWLLGGRPDPVELASSLGVPSLAAAIAERVADTETQLAETAISDVGRANAIVGLLAADLNELAQKL